MTPEQAAQLLKKFSQGSETAQRALLSIKEYVNSHEVDPNLLELLTAYIDGVTDMLGAQAQLSSAIK